MADSGMGPKPIVPAGKSFLSCYPGADRFGDRACVHQACPANKCIGGEIEIRCGHNMGEEPTYEL